MARTRRYNKHKAKKHTRRMRRKVKKHSRRMRRKSSFRKTKHKKKRGSGLFGSSKSILSPEQIAAMRADTRERLMKNPNFSRIMISPVIVRAKNRLIEAMKNGNYQELVDAIAEAKRSGVDSETINMAEDEELQLRIRMMQPWGGEPV